MSKENENKSKSFQEAMESLDGIVYSAPKEQENDSLGKNRKLLVSHAAGRVFSIKNMRAYILPSNRRLLNKNTYL